MRQVRHALRAFALAAGTALTAGLALAQSGNPFAAAVYVNDQAITNFELQQRAQILRLFRTPGNLAEVAREQLVNERLQLFAARNLGVELTEEDIVEGVEEFAGRADLTGEQFIAQLAGAGVEEQTLRDFIAAGVAWREVVRTRFGAQARVTDAEIDRALSLTSRRGSAEVLLSEIIIPARTPEEAARAEQLSLELSNSIRGTGAFAAAAAQYSASPSRENGGRVSRAVPLANLPPVLAQQLLTLAPGEVSDPVPIPNAVAVFQVRQIRETGIPEPDRVSVEYAMYLIPGGRSPEALAEAAKIEARIDRCGDLYGLNEGQPPERLIVEKKSPGEIPTDIALELAKLDEGETSTALTRGGALALLMLCERAIVLPEEVDRDAVGRRLLDQRLAALADGFLAELKAAAIIREP